MSLGIDLTEVAFGAGMTAFAALVFDLSHGEPFIGIGAVLLAVVVGNFWQNYEVQKA